MGRWLEPPFFGLALSKFSELSRLEPAAPNEGAAKSAYI
jgi:hypothetical protein